MTINSKNEGNKVSQNTFSTIENIKKYFTSAHKFHSSQKPEKEIFPIFDSQGSTLSILKGLCTNKNNVF